MQKLYQSKLERLLDKYYRTEETKIDEGIRELVIAINKLPFAETYESCAGHWESPGRLHLMVDGQLDIIELPDNTIALKPILTTESQNFIELLKKACEESNIQFPRFHCTLDFYSEIFQYPPYDFACLDDYDVDIGKPPTYDKRPRFVLRQFQKMTKDYFLRLEWKNKLIDYCNHMSNQCKECWNFFAERIRQTYSI